MSNILKNFFHTWHDFHHVEVRPHFLSEEGRDQMLEAMKRRENQEYIDLQSMEDYQWRQDQEEYEKMQESKEKISFLSEFIK